MKGKFTPRKYPDLGLSITAKMREIKAENYVHKEVVLRKGNIKTLF